jgi:predicted dehydrogenase
MSTNHLVRAGMIGVGGMARGYVQRILDQHGADTRLVAMCEPSPASMAAVAQVYGARGLTPPPNEPDLDRFLTCFAHELDAVFILTPHKYHHDQAKVCLEAGLDVLLEKPMVMTADEACSLIEVRDRTGKHLVVAFQGSLSPQVRTATRMIRSGEVGQLRSISATIWQNWGPNTVGTWRQQPDVSGGGMLFDTGAHMLNTVSDLAGQNFVEVAAWMDNRGMPVDIVSVVMGRLESGAYVTMQACGDTIRTCKSDIYVFCSDAILRTGAWGERLEMQRQSRKTFRRVPVTPSKGTWEQFLLVRSGQIENPSPPEIGLRMAKLWDAIKTSALQGGIPVRTLEALS